MRRIRFPCFLMTCTDCLARCVCVDSLARNCAASVLIFSFSSNNDSHLCMQFVCVTVRCQVVTCVGGGRALPAHATLRGTGLDVSAPARALSLSSIPCMHACLPSCAPSYVPSCTLYTLSQHFRHHTHRHLHHRCMVYVHDVCAWTK